MRVLRSGGRLAVKIVFPNSVAVRRCRRSWPDLYPFPVAAAVHIPRGITTNAYNHLPARGSRAFAAHQRRDGAITPWGKRLKSAEPSPTGICVAPVKNSLLQHSSSHSDSIRFSNVGRDGLWRLSGTSDPAGAGPNDAVYRPVRHVFGLVRTIS